jgi:hypothetical protein
MQPICVNLYCLVSNYIVSCRTLLFVHKNAHNVFQCRAWRQFSDLFAAPPLSTRTSFWQQSPLLRPAVDAPRR